MYMKLLSPNIHIRISGGSGGGALGAGPPLIFRPN